MSLQWKLSVHGRHSSRYDGRHYNLSPGKNQSIKTEKTLRQEGGSERKENNRVRDRAGEGRGIKFLAALFISPSICKEKSHR